MAGFYARCILPGLLHMAMRQPLLVPYRQRVAGGAEGRVLEMGIGSGLNLGFYGTAVTDVVGIEPSSALLARARSAAARAAVRTQLVEGSGEALPFESARFDTVVTTWTLCTIPDAMAALGEMRRVLKPGGKLLFVEHGQAPEPGIARWQDRLDPFWTRLAGGCHLNRPIADLVTQGGFRLDVLATSRVPGPRTHTFLYEGCARPV